MHPSTVVLAFDRETITIAALWSMIVASAVFLVGVAVIYRRERRAATARTAPGSGATRATGDGEGSPNTATAPFSAEEPPLVTAESEATPPEPD